MQSGSIILTSVFSAYGLMDNEPGGAAWDSYGVYTNSLLGIYAAFTGGFSFKNAAFKYFIWSKFILAFKILIKIYIYAFNFL